MEKIKGEDTAVVLDANVIIAGLISSSGINSRIALIAPLKYRCFYPETLLMEVLRHADIIAAKSGLSEENVRTALNHLTSHLERVRENKIAQYIGEVLREGLVKDEADAPYVAASLYLLIEKEFKQVILITWNTKDYNTAKLRTKRILIMKPPEFPKKYL